MENNVKKKLFVSGPVTGVPYAWKKFDEARLFYTNMGYAVTVPTDLPVGMSNADYARICLAMIDSADEVAFLPGWHDSVGAKLEHDYCYYTRKKVRNYADDAGRSGVRSSELQKEQAEMYDGAAVPDFEALGDNAAKCFIAGSGYADLKDKVPIKFLANEKNGKYKEELTNKEFAYALVDYALKIGYVADVSCDKDGWVNVQITAPNPCPPIGMREILKPLDGETESKQEKGKEYTMRLVQASDGKPKTARDVLVVFTGYGFIGKRVRVGYWNGGGWSIYGQSQVKEVLAWADLPEEL